jgi:hypothetical protein
MISTSDAGHCQRFSPDPDRKQLTRNAQHAVISSRTGSVPRAGAAASADQQHELPAHVTVLADAVGLGDIGEREGLHRREREAPGLDQLADPGERRYSWLAGLAVPITQRLRASE